MADILLQLNSNIKISMASAIETALSPYYAIGDDTGEIKVIPEWEKWDFSLPKIAMELKKVNETELSLGSDVYKNFDLILRIFADDIDGKIERDQLDGFISTYLDDNNIELLNYNLDTPTGYGWIEFENVGSTPDRIEKPDESTENVIIISADVKVKVDLN